MIYIIETTLKGVTVCFGPLQSKIVVNFSIDTSLLREKWISDKMFLHLEKWSASKGAILRNSKIIRDDQKGKREMHKVERDAYSARFRVPGPEEWRTQPARTCLDGDAILIFDDSSGITEDIQQISDVSSQLQKVPFLSW